MSFIGAAAVLAAGLGSLTPAKAQDDVPRYELHIKGGKLLDAVKSVSDQTDAEFFYSFDLVNESGINPVDGRYTLEEALGLMFEGTDLTGSLTENGMIVITRKINREAGMNNQGNLKKTLLAGAAAFLYGTGAYGADVALIEEGGDDGCPKGEVRGDDGKCERDYRKAPDILVVEGSQNADIRRTEDDVQPFVVILGDELMNSGSMNLEEYLSTRLPMNSQVQTTRDFTSRTPLDNSGQLNLRGLGTNQTLVLVDGRRIPGVGASLNITQPSINGIPPSAIERIEILPSTASAMYGGSATGGVINIILKRDYTGLDVELGTGGSFRGDSYLFNASVRGGTSLNHGRTRLGFGGSYSQQDPLMI